MLIALVELVLDARGGIVEAALGVAAVRPQLLVRRPEADAEAFGDALRHIDGEVGLARRRRIAACRCLDGRDRRQRQFVGHERVIGRQCRGKEPLSGNTMRQSSIGGGDARECGDDPIQR